MLSLSHTWEKLSTFITGYINYDIPSRGGWFTASSQLNSNVAAAADNDAGISHQSLFSCKHKYTLFVFIKSWVISTL